jgi:hypothetical protein
MGQGFHQSRKNEQLEWGKAIFGQGPERGQNSGKKGCPEAFCQPLSCGIVFRNCGHFPRSQNGIPNLIKKGAKKVR